MRAFFRSVAAMIVVSGVTGCGSLSYFAQAVEGHVKIMTARQDVEKLIEDPSTSEHLRAQMASASAIRKFATDELALPDNDSYRSYVDVHRDAVTWAIFAAPEFSLMPRVWCFPVFGCVPYRGYFSKESAIENAIEFQGQGLDVYVTGITAYSTLGWSSDPLLSTMLSQDETYLAATVFHELAHQRFYVNDEFRIQQVVRCRGRDNRREEMAARGWQYRRIAPLRRRPQAQGRISCTAVAHRGRAGACL